MSSGRSRPKAKSRKENRKNIPVSWIAVQPDASARTSLRSLADYLSEKETESPLMQQLPKRSLCLSPDCLKALENAEKLVEDAERQLSQLKLDVALADDFEEDSSRLVDETSVHIRKIVASTFEKGEYEPPPPSRDVFIPVRSKSRLSSEGTSSSARRKPATASTLDDDCLFCRDKSPAVKAPTDSKLSVQRGPAINIKAKLCVQTSKIVDIQPTMDTPTSRHPGSNENNVANFEFRHESIHTEDDNAVTAAEEIREAKDATTSVTGLEQPIERSNAYTETSIVRQPESMKLDESSDVDLSLGEPKIIAELDTLLSQQRTIIRKAHQSSQALDELFRKSTLSVPSDDPSPKSNEDYSIGESFDSVHSSDSTQLKARSSASKSHESCKSKVNFIEDPKSSSPQIPKPNIPTVYPPDVSIHKEIGESYKSNANFIENPNSSSLQSPKPNSPIVYSPDVSIHKEIVESYKSNANFIENPKSSSLQIPKPNSRIVYSSNISIYKEISAEKVIISNSTADTRKVSEEKKMVSSCVNTNVNEKDLGDFNDADNRREIDEKKETDNSLMHKTSHLIDSLSDDQSLARLPSLQSVVHSQLESKSTIDSRLDNKSTSIKSVKGADNSITTTAAEQIVSGERSPDLNQTAVKEHSAVSDNRRVDLLIDSPSSEQQKLNLLKKLESCSISSRYQCKRLPFTSTVLGDSAVRPTGSTIESLLQSELSSEATHSEGELCLSSSASYSLGEVRRKINVDSSTSYSSSTKVSSTSRVNQHKTPTLQCSIGEYFEPTK